ncbi:MAG: DUF4230 domain-containing protein [Bacilli bacterium]|nr:DUF4230 domain-containing protein [Bacilli bacterium]
MKKRIIFICLITITLFLTGCSENRIENLSENIRKIELTGDLVTYEAYFHNIIEHEKKAGSGLTHLLEMDRKLFAEYTGTIKLGIDMSEVKIDVNGSEISVLIPKAKIIGEPNVDEDDFKAENFIESKESINKNPITGNDTSAAFNEAQKNMKDYASSDDSLLNIAQKRAKVLIEENIKQFSGLSDGKYTIVWEYE